MGPPAELIFRLPKGTGGDMLRLRISNGCTQCSCRKVPT
jgi:hypothetical protein